MLRPDHTNITFSTMPEYIQIAKKIISTNAHRIRPGLSREMLSSDDAISTVAYAIMEADWKFDGRGSQQGYRKSMANFAIRRYVYRKKKDKKVTIVSIDAPFTLDSDNNESLNSILYDNCKQPHDIIDRQEMVERLHLYLNNNAITTEQAMYISQHYLHNVPMAALAKTNNMTRQNVHNIIQNGLKVLRVKFMEDGFTL